MTYRLTPLAEDDLEAVGDFIAADNPAAAVRLMQKFEEHWTLLAQYPRSGQARGDLMPGIRHLVVGEYLSFYRVESDRIVILRVLHGRRRITSDDMTG